MAVYKQHALECEYKYTYQLGWWVYTQISKIRDTIIYSQIPILTFNDVNGSVSISVIPSFCHTIEFP